MTKHYLRTTLIFTFLFSLATITANAQAYFQRTYGGAADENVNSIQPTYDGGYILAGWTMSIGEGGADAYLIKIDNHGDTLWTKAYGGSGDELLFSVEQTNDSGYIAAGYSDSYGVGVWDVYLIKTDANGDTLWTRVYGGANYETAGMVRQTPDSGYVVAGYTDSYGAGSYDAYVIRTDQNGDTLWTRTYGGGGNWDWFNAVQPTFDGGFIFIGTTMVFGQGGMEAWLVKTNNSGDTTWTRTYGTNGADDCYAGIQTSDSGYAITGITNSYGAGGPDAFLIKTDGNGDTLWTKTYGGGGDDRSYHIQQTSDDGYVISGYTNTFGPALSNIYLVRIDALGDTIFTKAYGGSGDEWSNRVRQASDGGFAVSAIIDSYGAGNNDFALIKTDTAGNSGECFTYNTTTETNSCPLVVGTNAAIINYGAVVSNTATVTTNLTAVDSLHCLVCDTLVTGFTWSDTLLTAYFTYASAGAESWMWYFGDGDSSSVQSPIHTYATDSTYYVCLVISNYCGSDTICDSVMVTCPKPVAGFTWSDSLLTVTFTDGSSGADSLWWDFGDGNGSNSQNPIHVYATDSTYYVCLYAYNDCGVDSFCDSITVVGTGIDGLGLEGSMRLYPNPTGGVFSLEINSGSAGSLQVQVFSLEGTMIIDRHYENIAGYHKLRFDLSNRAAGIYYLKLTSGGGVITRKIVLQ